MTRRASAGLALVGFVLVINLAFTALVFLFGYDDVLREPPGDVLRRFHVGGPPLVAAWTAFAAGALAFAWVGPMAERAAGMRLPAWLAPAAGIAMATGLLRWVVAVPVIAAAHQAPGAGEATRAAAEMAYVALHQFAGAGIGELLGTILLASWTWRFALALRPVHPWLARAGMATLPLWLAALSEPLATGWPGLPVLEAGPIAFMAWEAWLVALGVAWLGAAEGRRKVPL
jgi:hypothetical protein